MPCCFRKCDGLVDACNGRRVDDDVLASVSAQRGHQAAASAFGSVALPHQVAQVRPVEARDVLVRLAQVELREDVVPHAPRGAGGEGGDGHGPENVSRSALSWRYSGRNSWPHSEMQCASSMAKKATGTARSQSMVSCARQALGRKIQQPVFAGVASRIT